MQPNPFVTVWLIVYARLLQRQPSNTCLMLSYGIKDSLSVRICMLEAPLCLRCTEHVQTDLIRMNASAPSTYASQSLWTLHAQFHSSLLLDFILTSMNRLHMASEGMLSLQRFAIKVIRSRMGQTLRFCLVSSFLDRFTNGSIPSFSNLLLMFVSKCLVVYYLQSAYHMHDISEDVFRLRLTQ